MTGVPNKNASIENSHNRTYASGVSTYFAEGAILPFLSASAFCFVRVSSDFSAVLFLVENDSAVTFLNESSDFVFSDTVSFTVSGTLSSTFF